MAFTDIWDNDFEALPTDDNYGYEIDNYIRRTVRAVRERMEIDHVWKIGDDDGEHKVVTLQVQAKPSAVANKGKLYTKDVGGKVALYFLDEDGNEIKLANAGVSSSVPEGVITPWIGGFFSNSANGNFTNVLANTISTVNALLNGQGWYVCDGSALNDANSNIFNGASRYLPNLTDDRFLMGDTSAGGIGSSDTHTHSVTSNVAVANHTNLALDTHTHTGPSHNHKWYERNPGSGLTDYTYGSGGNKVDIGTSVSNGLGINVTVLENTLDDAYASNAGTGATGATAGTFSQNISVHSVTNNVVTSAATSTKPKYLSVFYLMKAR